MSHKSCAATLNMLKWTCMLVLSGRLRPSIQLYRHTDTQTHRHTGPMPNELQHPCWVQKCHVIAMLLKSFDFPGLTLSMAWQPCKPCGLAALQPCSLNAFVKDKLRNGDAGTLKLVICTASLIWKSFLPATHRSSKGSWCTTTCRRLRTASNMTLVGFTGIFVVDDRSVT